MRGYTKNEVWILTKGYVGPDNDQVNQACSTLAERGCVVVEVWGDFYQVRLTSLGRIAQYLAARGIY